jgi:hypothetical protein
MARVVNDSLGEPAVLGVVRRSQRLGDFAPALGRVVPRLCQLLRLQLTVARCLDATCLSGLALPQPFGASIR